MAVAPEAVRLLERVEDVDALDLPGTGGPGTTRWWPCWPRPPSATTSGPASWTGPGSASPTCGCPTAATCASPPPTARPRCKALAGRCDAVVVIGSENSSNTVALTKVAEAFGCPRVVRVNDASELPDDLSGTVGVTAGASAPEALVDAVVARLAPRHGVESSAVTVEEEYFPPPPELRDLLRGLEAALGLLNSVPRSTAGADAGPGRRPDHGGGRRARADRPPRLGRARLGGPRRHSAGDGSVAHDDCVHRRENVTMTTSFTSMDTSTAEQWGVIGAETMANQGRVADRVLRHARVAGRRGRRVRRRPADPLPADGHPGRAGRRRRRGGRGLALPRHRQGRLGAQPSRGSPPRSSAPTSGPR